LKDIRLIIGIVTIMLFVFVAFQSCGAYATVKSSNGIGNIGIIISFVALIAALICINTRDAYSGAFISAIFYALAGFLGLFNFTNHKIVFVYGFMCNNNCRFRILFICISNNYMFLCTC
jgi:hypothetical protein